MPDFDLVPICDGLGRPMPPLRPLTWSETRRLEHRRREQRGKVHGDWRERADLLTALEAEADVRLLSDAQVHEILGLTVGRLRDGTLSTPLLLEALAHLRRQPR